jgi:hypothetical protein
MLKHKEGDKIRVATRKWIDAQEKTAAGDIRSPGGCGFTRMMFCCAGKTATIVEAVAEEYKLDIDEGVYFWEDWMFDPDYDPYAELSARDAIEALLNGETLSDIANSVYSFNEDNGFLERESKSGVVRLLGEFKGLRRCPVKRTRPWTRWETLAWANSDESRGWFVRVGHDDESWSGWVFPMEFQYNNLKTNRYQRARLLDDHSGIDESTIQGFEAEE